MIVLYSIIAALVIFIAVILIRAAAFRPQPIERHEAEAVNIDRELAVKALSEMIKCRTVSSTRIGEEDEAEFERFKALLPTLFPSVYSTCELFYPSSRSILLKWGGESDGAPAVLMAHYDVVSVNEEGWTHSAFGAEIHDGFMWGRGTLDTKSTLASILTAAEQLIKSGFKPKCDIYFAFSGNEEIGGDGAPAIVNYFKEKGITPSFVLDEGGVVADDVFPGVRKRAAIIGIAEKGMLNVEYRAKSAGGHSSAPLPVSPIGKLSRACRRIEARPFKFRITEPASRMFDTMARYSTFGYRLIFANLWCFAPIFDLITKMKGGEVSAIVRTTTAFTQMEGSGGMNVIPESAKMISNHRIIPGESTESVIRGLRKRARDSDVEINVVNSMEPSRISVTEGEGWSRIGECALECFGDIIVSPYLMLACSDSRHYDIISDRVYRFSPMELSKADRALIHASDERISLESLFKAVEFYQRLIGKC